MENHNVRQKTKGGCLCGKNLMSDGLPKIEKVFQLITKEAEDVRFAVKQCIL